MSNVHKLPSFGDHFLASREKPKTPDSLKRFMREVNYSGHLMPCGIAKLRDVWSDIDGEECVDQIIAGMNAHIAAGTWKEKTGYKPPVNMVLENYQWMHPPAESENDELSPERLEARKKAEIIKAQLREEELQRNRRKQEDRQRAFL